MSIASTRAKQSTLEIAQGYVKAGLSIVPILDDGSKQPSTKWKEYQSRLPNKAKLVRWFKDGTKGIAIVCGKVSGNLETIDFDRESETIFFEVRETVTTERPEIWPKISCCQTPNGIHLRYRCDGAIDGNMVLAKDDNSDESEKPFIETRGEGGYALAPGCPAPCHPSGRIYSHLAGPALTELATLSAEERDYLITTCRRWHIAKVNENQNDGSNHFNGKINGEMPFVLKAEGDSHQPRQGTKNQWKLSPGDDFDQRADWGELLKSTGWHYVEEDPKAGERWRRPGKNEGHSAILHREKNRFKVFTTATFLEGSPDEGKAIYGKFNFYVHWFHGGDYTKATYELFKQGYGIDSNGNRYGKQSSKRSDDSTTTANGKTGQTESDGPGIGIDGFTMTDRGNAQRLIAWYGNDLRYVRTWSKWLVWDSVRWVENQEEVILHAKRTARKIRTDAIDAMRKTAGEEEEAYD